MANLFKILRVYVTTPVGYYNHTTIVFKWIAFRALRCRINHLYSNC